MDDEVQVDLEVEQRSPGRNGWKVAFFCLLILNIAAFIIVGILLIPAVRQARQAACRAQCRANLMRLARATADYVAENGRYPPAFVEDGEGKPLYSWRVLLLPYLGEEKLYRAFDHSKPWDSPHNLKLLSRIPSCFVCPGQGERLKNTFATGYAAVVGPDHVFIGARGVSPMAITDSLSSTLLFAEASGAEIPWTEPRDIQEVSFSRERGCSSDHSPGVQVVTCSGSVRYLSNHLRPDLFRALFTRNGNERTGEF